MERKVIGAIRIEIKASLLDDEDTLTRFHHGVQLAHGELRERSTLPCDRQLGRAGFRGHGEILTTNCERQSVERSAEKTAVTCQSL